MTVTVTQALTDFSGAALKLGDDELTLRRVCVEALLAQHPGETVDGNEKLKRFQLAQKIHGAESISLTAEEVALSKRLIGQAFAPLVSGQAWLLLDPACDPMTGKPFGAPGA